MKGIFLRGEIYLADLGGGVGSEQKGRRPVVIIQNDVGNKYSPTVIVAAISTYRPTRANLPTHYDLGSSCGLETASVVLTEQLRTIDKRRLEDYIGFLDEEALKELDHALGISIGLKPVPGKALRLCLCPACAENFRLASGHSLYRAEEFSPQRSTCTYCNYRLGYDYILRANRSDPFKVPHLG